MTKLANHPALLDEVLLCGQWAKWCADQGLPLHSADDLIHRDGLTAEQSSYIRKFQAAWEHMLAYSNAAHPTAQEFKSYDALCDALHSREGVAEVEEFFQGTGYIFDYTCPTSCLSMLRAGSTRSIFATPGWEGEGVDVQVEDEGYILNEGEPVSRYALPALTIPSYCALLKAVMSSVERSDGRLSGLV